MSAHDLGKAIAHVPRIIRLVDIGDWQPHYEIALENYVFNPYDLGSQRIDARRPCSGHEPLGGIANSQSAGRLSHHVGGSHKAEMSLVYNIRAESFGVPQTHELCAAIVQTAEAGYGR